MATLPLVGPAPIGLLPLSWFFPETAAGCWRVVLRHLRIAMHVQGLLEQAARTRASGSPGSPLPPPPEWTPACRPSACCESSFARCRGLAASRCLIALARSIRCGKSTFHSMRRHIRTLGLVAQVAQVALVDDLGVVGLGHAVDFHGRRFVDQIEQRREGLAQADAAAAAVADVEDALEFALERILVPENVGSSSRADAGSGPRGCLRACAGLRRSISPFPPGLW